MEKQRPDVIVLDINMPRMDGLTFLRTLGPNSGIGIVICSGAVGQDADLAVAALEAGAHEIISKPSLGVAEYLQGSRIVDAVRAAAMSRKRRGAAAVVSTSQERTTRSVGMQERPSPTGLKPRPDVAPVSNAGHYDLIAIGASTGGPEALHTLLERLPPNLPGIIISQHMPIGFTGAFARRLNESLNLEVKEAQTGDRVAPGTVLIAPGDQHLRVRGTSSIRTVELLDTPPVNRHKPSVDVMFLSVAQVLGKRAIGVLLTGMGKDGAEGLSAMKAMGAYTIAQDRISSVVYGMPRAAVLLGAASIETHLMHIPDTIVSRIIAAK